MRFVSPFHYRVFSVTMILILVFLFSSFAFAQRDPFGKPDTCRIVTFQDEKKNQVMASVSVFNDEELMALTLTFRYGDGNTPIKCDSIKYTKTRVEYFETKTKLIDTTNQTILIGLLPDLFGQNPPLKKGNGEVVRIYFTLKPGTKFQDFFMDTTFIKPFNTLKFVTSQVKGIYPVFDNRKAMVKGGIPLIPPKTGEEKAKTEEKKEEKSSKKDSS
jgi:hypothetical protein